MNHTSNNYNTKDILHSKVRSLFKKGHFEKDRNLQITAFLIDHGFDWEKSKALISEIFPKYPQEEFYSFQSRVYSMARREVSEKYSALNEAMKGLTKNQKKAIEAVFLKAEAGESHADIAKKLKITRSSLRSRIEGAKKKIIKALEEHYPPETVQRAYENLGTISF